MKTDDYKQTEADSATLKTKKWKIFADIFSSTFLKISKNHFSPATTHTRAIFVAMDRTRKIKSAHDHVLRLRRLEIKITKNMAEQFVNHEWDLDKDKLFAKRKAARPVTVLPHEPILFWFTAHVPWEQHCYCHRSDPGSARWRLPYSQCSLLKQPSPAGRHSPRSSGHFPAGFSCM